MNRLDKIKRALNNTEDPDCQYYDQSCSNDGARYLIARVEKLEKALDRIQNNSVPGGHDQAMAREALAEED